MDFLKINLKRPSSSVLVSIRHSLKNGQVVVLPTDTIYGLSCLADDIKAVKKIYRLKKRNLNQSLLVLVSSLEMAREYAFISKRQAEILEDVWFKKNRPHTFILKSRKRLSFEKLNNIDTLALRLPKRKFLIKIIEDVGVPIISTSFNLSGQNPIDDVSNLSFLKEKDGPDLIIDAGKSKNILASRIVNLCDVDRPTVIRS